jgi:hypothetical protein
MHGPMQQFQNELAYLAVAVIFARRMLMKLAPGDRLLAASYVPVLKVIKTFGHYLTFQRNKLARFRLATRFLYG